MASPACLPFVFVKNDLSFPLIFLPKGVRHVQHLLRQHRCYAGCLLNFTVYFTKNNLTNGLRAALQLAGLYACFEAVLFALNPFNEIALGYVHRDTVIARYAYQMKPLYWLHLLFTYALVAAVLALLIVKLCRVPREYRAQFLYVIGGIVVLVAVNGVFLYLPG